MPLAHAARSFASFLSSAWRSLKRRPGYFAIAVSSLAIALGLATTVIAHLDSLVHPDLGTPHADRLFMGHAGGSARSVPSDSELVRLFSAIPEVERAAVIRQANGRTLVSTGLTTGPAWNVWRANRDVFDVAGAKPLTGRWFLPNEHEGSAVALISEDMWHREFKGVEDLAKMPLSINGLRHNVVGVIPRELPLFSFQRRSGDEDDRRQVGPSGYIVLPAAGTTPDTAYGFFNARLVIRARARARNEDFVGAAKGIGAQLQARHGVPPGTPRGPGGREVTHAIGAGVYSVGGYTIFRVDGYQKAMLVAAAIIVVIACANVSALMLARAVAKRRDQALRLALGAGRRHVIQDVAAEVAVIAFAGAVAGLLIGDWSMRILAAVTPPDLPWLGFREPHWSPWVFAGLFGVVMLAVMIASIIPAAFVSGIAPVEQLKDNSGTTTGRPRRAFQLLVVGELALSLILLFGAVLVAKSADQVAGFNFGYEPRGLTTVSAEVLVLAKPSLCKPRPGYVCPTEMLHSDMDNIATRLRNEPGIASAAWTSEGGTRDLLVADETQAIGRQLLNPVEYYAGSGFFQTLGIPITEGRDFVETDRSGNGGVILDALAVRALFPDGKAVGKLVKFATARQQGTWIPVVGVVRSVIHQLPADPEVDVKPVVYMARPTRVYAPRFVVRAERNAGDVTPRVASIVADLMPAGASQRTGPWLRRYEQMLTTRRFTAGMFLTLSFASLALAAAGLFGVLSYTVNQRMREFAVRVALGAQRGHVVKLVLTDGFVMALAGTAIGAAVALKAAFVLWEWLWGVYPVDVQALLISEGLLLTITAAGAILPSLRATRANPVDVMRST